MSGAPYDVIIIGAGPAGLSAALFLGRCRRTVLLCDDGHPRNYPSHALHGFLTRDGIEPAEFRSIAREQLHQYPTVEIREATVKDAFRRDRSFEVALADGTRLRCRKLLLATGLIDELPQIQGIEAYYGRSVFHCPYCDGWEQRDRSIAVYARGDHKGGGLALELTQWSRNLVLCTDGPSELSDHYRQRLARYRIPVREERIVELAGADGMVEAMIFETGERLTCEAIFFNTGCRQASDLAQRLGCGFDESGGVDTSSAPGVYTAGDAARDVLQAIVAAAEGAEAAMAINTALLKEDLR